MFNAKINKIVFLKKLTTSGCASNKKKKLTFITSFYAFTFITPFRDALGHRCEVLNLKT